MSLYGSFSRHRHFDELNFPLDTAVGVLSPTQRRQICLNNLMGSGALQMPSGAFIAPPLAAQPTVTTTSTTVMEDHGDGVSHVTKLTLTNFALGNTADNASLALGAKLFDFPAGSIAVENSSIVGGITAAISVTTNTPEVGLGTTVGTGAVAVLGTTMEDLCDGGASGAGGDNTAPNVAGGAFYKTSNFTAPVVIKATGGKAHACFLNIAATWVDVTAAGAATFTGVVTVKWRKID